jgi:hypothetical protein
VFNPSGLSASISDIFKGGFLTSEAFAGRNTNWYSNYNFGREIADSSITDTNYFAARMCAIHT